MKDRDVRDAIKAHLNALHSRDSNTRIVEEMNVWSGTVRIDLAVINGELSGFELKSDRDTLKRLPLQAEIYSRVFDRVTLVVGHKHASKSIPLIPPWWGVTVARSSGDGDTVSLSHERPASINPAPDAHLIAEFLWKDEAIAVLSKYCLDKGWRAKRIRLLHERLAENLPLEALKDEVREVLKARTNWLGQSRTNNLDVPIDTDQSPVFQGFRSGIA